MTEEGNKSIEVRPEAETALAIPAEELDEMFGESSLDMTTGLSFNVVKIIRETGQFDLGNEVYAKTIKGHILFKHRAAQFWDKSFDERGPDDDPRPVCYSIDGFSPCGGEKPQSEGTCSSCPQDKWGSDPKGGKGKACRNTMRFLFLQDGAVIPVVLSAPPTSLGKKSPLTHWLNSVPNDVSTAFDAIGMKNKKGGPIVEYWTAHVELSLEKKDFAGDLMASILVVKTLDIVTPKSDPTMLRLLHTMMKDTSEMYKAEQLSYIESEQTEPEPEPEYSDETADADADDNVGDNIPI